MPPLHKLPVELRKRPSRQILPVSASSQPDNVTTPHPSPEYLQIQNIAKPPSQPFQIMSRVPNLNHRPTITFGVKDGNIMLWDESAKALDAKSANLNRPTQIGLHADDPAAQGKNSNGPIFTLNVTGNEFNVCQSPTGSVEIRSTEKSKRLTSQTKASQPPRIILQGPILQKPSIRLDTSVVPVSRTVVHRPAMAPSENEPISSHPAFPPPTVPMNLKIANSSDKGNIASHHQHVPAIRSQSATTVSNKLASSLNDQHQKSMNQSIRRIENSASPSPHCRLHNRNHSHQNQWNSTLANRFLLRPPEPSHLDTTSSHDDVKCSRHKRSWLSTSRSFDGLPSSHKIRHTASNQNLSTGQITYMHIPNEEDAFADFLHMTPHQGSFVYKNLENTEKQIRLLRIRPKRRGPLSHVYPHQNGDEISCDIIHVSFEDHPPYLALSYTWGHPDDEQHSISLDDKAFEVKENLYHALHQLRTGFQDTYLWIDAICINQKEGVERNHQVGNMRKIYERAEKVLVWLGKESKDSHHALLLANYLHQYRHSEENLAEYVFKNPEIAVYFTALKALFSRDYWKRIWVVQELTVARDVIVLCGSKTIPLQVLIEAQEVMKSDQGQGALAAQPLEEDIWSQIKWKGPSSIEASRKGFLSKNISLYDAIQYHYQKLASNPRDKIFALMGLANDVELHTLKIDYSKSVAEVFYQFAVCEIKISLRLDLITKVQYDKQNRFNLPSWIPDWTFNKRAHVRLQNIRRPEYRYNASLDTHANISFVPGTGHILMKGVQVGVIKNLGMPTNMQSPEDWENGVIGLRAWGALLGVLAQKRNEQPGTQPLLEEFARTLMCGHVTTEDTRAGFLRKLLGAIAYLIFELYPDSNLSDVLKQYYHDEILSKPKDRQLGYAQLRALHAQEKFWDRRFFLTDRNQMGLGQEVEFEDIIFIPFGCSGPIVLRRNDAVCYRVIGECYVDSVMYGEAMESLQRNEFRVMEFRVS